MKIASWNVESIHARHDQVVALIDANEPEVVCLQETKAGTRKFPRQGFESRGYELNEPRSIAATVGGVRLHTAYAPNGRKVGTHTHQIKLAWFTLYTAWLEAEREHFEHVMLAADLNIAPLDIDVWELSRYRKRNLTSPPERAAFEHLLSASDLVDVVRAAFGDEPAFTWWNRRSDFYETNRGWRLDHVLTSPGLVSRVTDLTIDRAERGRDGSTDHAPLLVTMADQ